MATATNIPNMNPTGVIGSGSGNTAGGAGTPFSSFMPGTGTGGAGTTNMGNAANPNPTQPTANPYMATAAQPAAAPTPAGTVMPGGGVAQTGNLPSSVAGQTVKQLQDVYGSGMGQLIWQYLQSNGGYNSAVTGQAVSAQTNAMQQQIQLGANSLESMLGAQGVSGASTENTQSLTNYENQATTQENAIAAQEYYNMWNDSQNREVSVLEGAAHDTATAEANKPDWMDYVTTGLEIAGAVAEL